VEFEWGDDLPTLAGERVELRSLRESDVADLFEIYSDREVMRYWTSPPHERREQTEQLLSEIHHGFRIRRLFEWGIARRSDNRLIGTVTLFRVDTQHRRAEIGYALARSAWGMGYVTEALSVLIRFAFEEMGLHRLEADADPRNERSLKALARQGFRREGTQLERYWLAGEIQDAALLGLLRDHWPPRNAASPSIPPGRTPRPSIIGSWDLSRWSALLNDGTEVLPFGERCRGRLCYDASGQMSLQIVKDGRPMFESGDPFGGTSFEIAEAFHGSVAYYGRYSADVESGIVRHHIDGSSFPNWIGTVQKRRFEVDGRHLMLTAVAANAKEGPRAGAHHTLQWRRLDR
jgi:ribosomal-protein-alanine N-acetyltransferase